MNTSRKIVLILPLFFLCSAATALAGDYMEIDPDLAKQCEEARFGVLDVSRGDYGNIKINAYLFDCAVGVTISPPSPLSGRSKSDAERNTEKNKRMDVAQALLEKGVDVNFTNRYGDTLLISVVSSFLSDEWKENIAIILINQGIDIRRKNQEGITALDLVKHRGTDRLVSILLERAK